MSFCATWVLFDSSGRSLRSQQRKRSLVSESFLRGRVGTFQLQGGLPPSAVRSRSHVQGIPLSDTKLLWQFLSYKDHHWVRDNSWVQIIIINVIYSLAREDLLVTINTHELSQWGKTERDKRKQLPACFYIPLCFKAFFLSLPPGRDVSSFTP